MNEIHLDLLGWKLLFDILPGHPEELKSCKLLVFQLVFSKKLFWNGRGDEIFHWGELKFSKFLLASKSFLIPTRVEKVFVGLTNFSRIFSNFFTDKPVS